ncbi:MAG: aminotransferase class V-fold PLP-dependent enzyme, partial [Alphaproteobacteria bacterium]|nr:aminotransferase class V-fold PLP-dependent enzyme [Alphaproteobacteria bacterium]
MKKQPPEPIYLDWNATAPLHAVAREAIVQTLTEVGNPSSVHIFGRAARQKLDQARVAILKLVGLPPELSEQFPAVIFTASGTEANNLAVNGWPRLAISDIEHSSMLLAREDAVTLGVLDNGLVDLAAVETICELWRGSQFMVSVMLANNETGVIQPIAEIAQIVHAAGGYLHSDACQAAGRIRLDMAELGVDLLTLSGHKLGGGYGSAALVRRTEIPLKPLLNGGGQEFGLRSGTENLTAIAGFAAIAQIEPTLLAAAPKVAKLRDRIAALPMSAQWWKRIFLGNAMDVELDGTGRILISPE